jgi:hypothetical protein
VSRTPRHRFTKPLHRQLCLQGNWNGAEPRPNAAAWTGLSTTTPRIGAPPTTRTSRLALTKGLHRRLCLQSVVWYPRVESNHRCLPSEGGCRCPSAGMKLVPQAGVEPAKPAFVARAPCPSAGMKGVGACRRLVASIEQAGRGFSPLQSPAPQPPVPRPVYLNSSPKMVPHPGIYPGRCS